MIFVFKFRHNTFHSLQRCQIVPSPLPEAKVCFQRYFWRNPHALKAQGGSYVSNLLVRVLFTHYTIRIHHVHVSTEFDATWLLTLSQTHKTFSTLFLLGNINISILSLITTCALCHTYHVYKFEKDWLRVDVACMFKANTD